MYVRTSKYNKMYLHLLQVLDIGARIYIFFLKKKAELIPKLL